MSEASRRRFLQFSGAAAAGVAAVAAGGLFPSAAVADDTLAMAGGSNRPSWAPTKYLIDCHCHHGSGPTVAELAPDIHSPRDWGALRTKQPEKFAKAFGEEAAVDDSAIPIRAMDKFGVTHAIIQTAPNKGASNQKHKVDMFARVVPEFGARSRTQGVTVMMGVGKTF